MWSERPFSFAFDGDGGLEVDGQDIVLGQEGSTLASAFRAAASKHFPTSGRTPAEQMFIAPQYNTWIEMPYSPTQQAVLDYEIVKALEQQLSDVGRRLLRHGAPLLGS